MAVYFFQVGEDGPIKIGVTDGVADRFSASQTQIPYQLHVLGVISNGNCTLEQELHFRFRLHWVRGEWFMPCPDLLEYIREHAKPYGRPMASARKVNLTGKPLVLPRAEARPRLTASELLDRAIREGPRRLVTTPAKNLLSAPTTNPNLKT